MCGYLRQILQDTSTTTAHLLMGPSFNNNIGIALNITIAFMNNFVKMHTIFNIPIVSHGL